MKALYLVRHAKSSWKQPELSDFERPLNKRGRNDAPRMAKLLHDLKIVPDAIIASPANRAATTARIFAKTMGFPLNEIQYIDQIYEASVHTLYDILHEIEENYGKVMIVGHNPGMTFLANSLSNHSIANLPTCGIFAIDIPNSPWNEISEDSGTMKFFEYPKNIQTN